MLGQKDVVRQIWTDAVQTIFRIMPDLITFSALIGAYAAAALEEGLVA